VSAQTATLLKREILGRDDNDGNVSGLFVLFHPAQHCESVDLGHHQIEQYQVRAFTLNELQPFSTIARLDDLVAAPGLYDAA
jgi:hypothetical protein